MDEEMRKDMEETVRKILDDEFRRGKLWGRLEGAYDTAEALLMLKMLTYEQIAEVTHLKIEDVRELSEKTNTIE